MTSAHTDSSSGPSPPASPATTMTSTHSDASPAVDNSLDDIFGSSPPHETRELPNRPEQSAVPNSTSVEPSDLPSLRRQHVTAGYRDGVTVSKGERVQDGFDAGFPIGAQLGMRAGTILGILEGITRGLENRSTSVVKKPARGASSSASTRGATETTTEKSETRELKEKILRAYQDAVKTLDVQAVFTGFEAPASGRVDTDSGEINADADAGEKPETQLGRKGEEVIGVWEERLGVPAWEKNMEALDMKEHEREQGDKGAAGERS